ncbi:glycosyltransferase [Alkalilacustris brevis]|uniref:glycosyltransferase n=1 Tax=Alkalilacustris brevis TaxID=2026338 RepID=UPI000E0D545E|nr:glycosyltransferase [Alkalilacustris brevis]
MKTLHLINSTRSGGGAQEMLRKLVCHRPASVEHRVMTLFTPPDTPLTVTPDHCLGLRGPMGLPAAVRRMRALMRREVPDVIVSWMYHSSLLATIAAPRGRRLIWNMRHSLEDISVEKPATRLVIRACARLSRWPDATIYCAEAAVPQHAAIGFHDRRAAVIPNGFDTGFFQPLDAGARRAWHQKLGVPEGAFLVGNAGRFHPMKNHRGLLAAFAAVAAERPDLHLLLAGRGIDPDNTALVSEIQSLGLEARVTLAGLQDDMPGFLGALDLYVSASLWGEGFPNVIGEAMACGTPVLATDVGDSARIVGDAGFVAESATPEAIAAALRWAVETADKGWENLRSAARNRVMEAFSLPAVTRQYEEFLMQIAGR